MAAVLVSNTNFKTVVKSCPHEKIIKYKNFQHCSDCGLLLQLKEQEQITVLRQDDLKHDADVSPAELLQTLIQDEQFFTHVKYNESQIHPDIINYKKVLIDWLFEIGQRFYQSNLTIHIAIAYLERAYQNGLNRTKDNKLKTDNQLRVLAVTCLLLASKYDELDDRIPFINDMSKILKKIASINHADVLKLETEVLFSLNWDLIVITPLHFVYSITSQGCVFEQSDNVQLKIQNKNKLKTESSLQIREKRPINSKTLQNLRKYAEFFADLSTHLYELKKYKCSQVGLACVVCARKMVNIIPVWNQNLKDMTTLDYKEIEKPFKILFTFYKQCFTKGSPSSAKENQISQIQVNQSSQNINQISAIALTLDLSQNHSSSKSTDVFDEKTLQALTQRRQTSKVASNPIKVNLMEFPQQLGIKTTRQSDINGKDKSKINLMSVNKTLANGLIQQPKLKCNSSKNLINVKKNPSQHEILLSQPQEYQMVKQKAVSKKTQDKMALSSAYSTASNIANLNNIQQNNSKNISRSQDPILKQKLAIQNSQKSFSSNHQAFLFNPKNEYFGMQVPTENPSKLKVTISQSISPGKQQVNNDIKSEIVFHSSNNNSKGVGAISTILKPLTQQFTQHIIQPWEVTMYQNLNKSNGILEYSKWFQQYQLDNEFLSAQLIALQKIELAKEQQFLIEQQFKLSFVYYYSNEYLVSQSQNVIIFKDKTESSTELNSCREVKKVNTDNTKEMIIMMQNKLEMSKKSKSVESLMNMQGLNQRKAIINQIASKMVKGRDFSQKNKQILKKKLQNAANPLCNETSILASADFTYQSSNQSQRVQPNNNQTQCNFGLNNSNTFNLQNTSNSQSQIMQVSKQTIKNSQKKKPKVPILNTQAIDATKKRILSILNTKLTKKLVQPQIAQLQMSLNKCNSSTYLGTSQLNQSSMFSLKTHSARDNSSFPTHQLQIQNSSTNNLTAQCTARQSLAATSNKTNIIEMQSSNKLIQSQNAQQLQANQLQSQQVQVNNKAKFEKRLSMQRMNQNHTIQCGKGGPISQCPSTSYLYVVDEEEKIQSITNSIYSLQKQKTIQCKKQHQLQQNQ
ncbi:n-terminal domain containing protein [Stylonychia lemnae]|uniref:N-terminal domain containing protein n=1 Tax=Stylonychia lemnae TaxID=5949 RepID=A0A078BAH5_STYLE|nr:n-terminal domain containing protein [Stylonychia lemnae]|eukprot:CDW90558.1 n-terminal domain containing protein [Stylonychia lemnae]